MTYEQNLKAILDSHLTEIKDEIKDSIINSILRLKTTGKWINKKCRDGSYLPCCSVCGESSGTQYEYNYCPNCGAKMEAENECTD